MLLENQQPSRSLTPGPRAPRVRAMGRVAALAIAVVVAAGCGPRAGAPCFGRSVACESPSAAAECRQETWTEIPCRGLAGCRTNMGQVICDMSLNLAGDACPLSAENEGIRYSAGGGILECHGGALVRTRSCTSCSRSGDIIVCTP